MQPKIKHRLYIENNLSEQKNIILNEGQSHYICNVLRLTSGDKIKAFDAISGEYVCEITKPHKKSCEICVLEKIKDFYSCPDIWLVFAPVKKDKTDFIIEKSTELGVSKIIPAITDRTITEKVKIDRLKAQAVEASEQSRRQDIPDVQEVQSLKDILSSWDNNRTLYFMDEAMSGNNIADVFIKNKNQKSVAILVGPEGGFTEQEAEQIKSKSFVKTISLGKRILRAETAVLSAISVWQSISGDWGDL